MEEQGDEWFAELEYAWPDREKQLGFGELLLCYGSSKHLLFMATEGYCSDKDCETLGQDDAIYIHTWKTQKRVVAKNLHDYNYVSIPLDYPLEFQILPDGKKDTLANLAKNEAGFPLEVGIRDAKFYYNNSFSYRVDVPMRKLELMHIYEETYVIGNYMLNGNIQYPTVMIPLYLPIRGVVAEGLLNHPPNVWKEIMDYFKGYVESQDLNVDDLLDKSEINMYSKELVDDGNDTYATLQPDIYIKVDMSSLPPIGATPPPRPPRYNREQKKTSALIKMKDKICTKIKDTTISFKRSRKNSITGDNDIDSRPLPPVPPPPRSRVDDVTSDDVAASPTEAAGKVTEVDEQNYDEVQPAVWGRFGIVSPKVEEPKGATNDPDVGVVKGMGLVNALKEKFATDVAHKCVVLPQMNPRSGSARPQNDYQRLPPVPKSEIQARSAMKPPGATASNEDEKRTKQDVPMSPTERVNTMTVKPSLRPKPKLSIDKGKCEQKPVALTSSREVTIKQKREKEIASISDIPDDLTTLSVEQVVDCLQLLKLGQFSETFKEHQIDGSLLVTLDTDTLIECFKMNKLEAHKLEQFFAKNWRPKIN